MSALFDKVKNIIAEELSIDESKIQLDSRLIEDLGADSIDAVQLMMRVEEEFDIEVSDEVLSELKSVKELVSYLEKTVK
ncbi:acyl carrier protein [Acholeplasma equifetale]|jgi:acyl carrier protein|uniref:acyl carrier protein n=1 Tax=Acholeplasma equifetale TaxID=264634 RepID=UPI000479EA05|nr:acyl carrier protein [Acholeplasma equifetale]HHY96659.1 acyl carrier protein [Acholeplasma sp.]